jgi:alkyl sulfatase BDS1-like metallo-beta-lactamase superfamily hydrolase
MTYTPERKPASAATRAVLAPVVNSLPFDDLTDFDLARRGFLAAPPERAILGRMGGPAWNLDDYAYQTEGSPAPDTVHPSLWRQAQLNNIAGLFEVVPGVYQVRGLDISNITFVRGERGWIIIDPLTGTEMARVALAMVNEHVEERPVTAVIYTHSHTDHFGGILGVTTRDAVEAGEVPIFAPAGFLEEVVSENIIAGTAMLRRATYMYGALLPKDAQGHVDTGLGKQLPAAPMVSLVAPTRDVTDAYETVVVDGTTIEFQLTPGTEAPAEMNMYFPQYRALCLAENCTANFHNLYTLRGAQVRDGLAWSKYTHEAMLRYQERADVTFASHHWPRWGREAITEFLEDQRDLYRYVHDQTMRLANLGYTSKEISEQVALPDGLAQRFYLRDYYGTVRHNTKAVYQRYLGWFDANPASLNPWPPQEAGRRYVEFMGGADEVIRKAAASADAGDYRWAAEVMNHLVFADPSNQQARFLQADILEQLGYQSESGPWRDFYLTGAQELRANGTILKGFKVNGMGPHIVVAMKMSQVFDVLGVRLNGPQLAHLSLRVNVVLEDRDEQWSFGLRHGTLHAAPAHVDEPTHTLRGTFDGLTGMATGNSEWADLLASGALRVEGDATVFQAFVEGLTPFTFDFEIVLP